jgi:hypothetical protein
MTASDPRHAEDHAASRAQERQPERSRTSCLRWIAARGCRHDGAADVPSDIGDISGLRWKPFQGHFRSSTARGAWIFRRAPDRTPQPPAPTQHGRLRSDSICHIHRCCRAGRDRLVPNATVIALKQNRAFIILMADQEQSPEEFNQEVHGTLYRSVYERCPRREQARIEICQRSVEIEASNKGACR